MCQAYAAEAAWISRCEDRYTLHGFVARLEGKPRQPPPRSFGYELKAWEHGWNCANNAPYTLPWAAERLINLPNGDADYERRQKIRDRFRATGKLDKRWVAKFKKEGWVIS